jgi:molybdopterin-containing oxidoreductase family membrane subunit
LFLLYARTFPVIAQAEVKSILKSSGHLYKKLRSEKGDDVKHYNLDGVTSVAINEVIEAETPLVDNSNSEENTKNLLGKLGSFDAATQTADDLKKISGVGPVMEKKLNQLGIYTFDQVSKMTDTEYDLLDSIIGEFPGRAKRDDWAGQASKLKNN